MTRRSQLDRHPLASEGKRPLFAARPQLAGALLELVERPVVVERVVMEEEEPADRGAVGEDDGVGDA